MGITGLWDEIGSGELVSLAQLATHFLREKGRPLRIAVDEAGWRFNNLTPHQVAAIKEKEPAARPIEKAIFHRIVCLLQLNIQLLFVFDGPKRPWKRGRRGGSKVDWNAIRETKALLSCLSVPHHMAPGEAEAECARLQQAGIVDGVWTDDGDALMFGTTMLIKTHHEKGGTKSKTHVKLYRAEEIKKSCGLDRDGFVLFALLAGGDYDTKGLPGCGPKTALKLAKEGFGQSLLACSDVGVGEWCRRLECALRGKCEIPPGFPNMRALRYYSNPTVSSYDVLHSLRTLQLRWDQPLDETKLRVFLQRHYNIQIKGYQKHILPILLLRTLCATQAGRERVNNIYSIDIARTRKKKGDNGTTVPLQRKITFLPQPVTSLDLNSQPEGPDGEDWPLLSSKTAEAFDATARVECEMLLYALEKGVPLVLQTAADEAKNTSTRKRKSGSSNHDVELSQTPKRRKNNVSSVEDTRETRKLSHNTQMINNSTRTDATSSNKTGIVNEEARAKPKSVPTQFRRPPTMDFCPFAKVGNTEELNKAAQNPKRNSVVIDPSEGDEDADDDGLCLILDPPSPLALVPHAIIPAPSNSSMDDVKAKRIAYFQRSQKSSTASGRSFAEAIILD